MTKLGIGDCSEYDTFDSTDFNVAKANGCSFAIVRATTTGAWVNGRPGLKEDKMFVKNAAKIDAAVLTRISYAWFDPRIIPGAEQANFLIATCRKAGGPGWKAVVDVEPGPVETNIVYTKESVLRLKDCLERLVYYGWKPAIYTAPTFLYELELLTDISWMRAYQLMIAHYAAAPSVPFPWHPGNYLIWQYTAWMKGSYYGFYGATPDRPSPRICMAVM